MCVGGTSRWADSGSLFWNGNSLGRTAAAAACDSADERNAQTRQTWALSGPANHEETSLAQLGCRLLTEFYDKNLFKKSVTVLPWCRGLTSTVSDGVAAVGGLSPGPAGTPTREPGDRRAEQDETQQGPSWGLDSELDLVVPRLWAWERSATTEPKPTLARRGMQDRTEAPRTWAGA